MLLQIVDLAIAEDRLYHNLFSSMLRCSLLLPTLRTLDVFDVLFRLLQELLNWKLLSLVGYSFEQFIILLVLFFFIVKFGSIFCRDELLSRVNDHYRPCLILVVDF